jgi:hypothetical protein
MDENELIARVADGDETALHELFLRYAPWLAARLRAGMPAAGMEDVLQQTFLGPNAGLVGGLVSAAALHRAVLVDNASAANAVRPYTWLLEQIGSTGVRLTPAGYLPPALVGEAMAELGWEEDWYVAPYRERLASPVWELRRSARRLGLVRKQRGVLLRTVLGTRLGHNPGQLWWHIAAGLPAAHDDAALDAGQLLLLAVAAAVPLDTQTIGDLLCRGLIALGWRDAKTGRPLDEWQAFRAAYDTWACLRGLGAIPRVRFGEPAVPPPPAGIALARAALRGQAFNWLEG